MFSMSLNFTSQADKFEFEFLQFYFTIVLPDGSGCVNVDGFRDGFVVHTSLFPATTCSIIHLGISAPTLCSQIWIPMLGVGQCQLLGH
jgi:hypothetical protein